MKQHTILLFGPSGQVGWELQRCLAPLGIVVCAARTPAQGMVQADFTDMDSLRQVVNAVQPSIIVNASAYTAVDKAEEETEAARLVNAEAPAVLAELAKARNALFIHYSTDYVFDGSAQTPYVETDPVKPLGVYGATKLAGEQGVMAVDGASLIFRTAWVYGARGKNFLLTMQRLARERDELRVVADQWGAPTWSRCIAEGTAQVLSQLISPQLKADWQTLSGIYHLTCAGETNWHGFAQTIIAAGERQPIVHPITTAEYPTPAARPAYSVLNNDKLLQQFGVQLPAWDHALALCLAEQAG